MPVKDELREEEVLACIVLKQARPDKAMADALVQYLPGPHRLLQGAGLIHFVPDIPTTGTQKIQRHHLSKGHRPALGGRDPGHAQPEAASITAGHCARQHSAQQPQIWR